MFEIGEHIVYGVNGICRVADVGPSPYDPTDTRIFYLLIPVNNHTSSSIYTPVDNAHVPMRRLMTRDEIDALITALPEIETLQIPVEKQRREVYRATIHELRPEGYVSVIKTVNRRRRDLAATHKHFPVTDLEYGRLARHLLCSECAHVLGLTEDEADTYLLSSLQEAE